MDRFLVTNSVSQRSKESCSPRPTLQSNLLFNPQRRRQEREPSEQYESAWGRGNTTSSYWKTRTAKLSSQAPAAASKIFDGLSFYFNGRSGDKQTMHLKGAVCKHGGKTTPFLSVRGVTHIVAENLSGVKTDKAMKSLKTKVVHPDWVLCCMREGRLLPEAPFRVVRSQKLNLDDFFGAEGGKAGTKPEEHPPPQPTRPTSSKIDDSDTGRHRCLLPSRDCSAGHGSGGKEAKSGIGGGDGHIVEARGQDHGYRKGSDVAKYQCWRGTSERDGREQGVGCTVGQGGSGLGTAERRNAPAGAPLSFSSSSWTCAATESAETGSRSRRVRPTADLCGHGVAKKPRREHSVPFEAASVQKLSAMYDRGVAGGPTSKSGGRSVVVGEGTGGTR